MPVAAYRVCRRIYARLDGQGARRVGGRWNSPGLPVVYMAQSIALAVLENLVHMSRQDYPAGYVTVAAKIPDHVALLDYSLFLDLTMPSDEGQKRAGDAWLIGRTSAVLRVPSAIIRGEWNYLMNPLHLDFAQIAVEPPAAFQFDQRLFPLSSTVPPE
jgi:RES domain-containing protein